MEKTGATSWLQIAANIGLIAGLALVAWQINQTSDLARDRLYHDRFDVWFAMQIATFGENASEVIARADYAPNDPTSPKARLGPNGLEVSQCGMGVMTFWLD